MQFFNPTYEKFEVQHDSKVYTFNPQEFTEMPEWPKSISIEVMDRVRQKGIFEKTQGMSKKDFERAKLEALKVYLEGELSTRIMNYNSYKDAMDKAGKTVEQDYKFLQAQRWKKEISTLVNYEEEKMGVQSFLKPEKEPVVAEIAPE